MSFKNLSVFFFFVVLFVIIHISLLNNESNVIGNSCRTETNISGICIPLSQCAINNDNKISKLNNYNKYSASAFPKIICCPDNYLQPLYSKMDGSLNEKQSSLLQKNDFKIQQQIQREMFNQSVVKRRKYKKRIIREIRLIEQPSNTLTQDQWNNYLEDIRSGKIQKQGQTVYVDCKSFNAIPDSDTRDLVINIEIDCGDEKFILTTPPTKTTTATTNAPESSTIETIKISMDFRPLDSSSSESEEDTTPLPQQPSTTENDNAITQSPTRKAVTACNEWKENYNPLQTHIIDGSNAELGEFPYIAALGYLNKGADDYSFECGSTLISNNYVITAAHCVQKKTPKIIRMGKLTLSALADNAVAIDRNIKNTYIHANYSKKFKYHDIALLELDKPVVFTSLVYPACLHTNESDLEDDTIMTVAGWSVTEIGTRATILQKTNVNFVLRSECNSKYIQYGLIRSGIPEGLDDGQMCAMDKANLSDSCQGDSGGPLVIVDKVQPVATLHGIVSFGAYCASLAPSVYVKVNYYLDWIESIVWPDK